MKSRIVLFSLVISFICLLAACTTTEVVEPEKVVLPQELISQNRYDEAKEMFVSKKFLNFQDEKGNTPLHVAAKTSGAEDMVSFLIELGADTSILNLEGNTALHIALTERNLKSVKILSEAQNALYTPNSLGITPVDYVVENKSNDLFNAIISEKSGAIKDVNGQNLVHHFAKNNLNEAITICAKNSVPMSIVDNEGNTPLTLVYAKAEQEEKITDQYKDMETAATLIRGKCEPADGAYYYFEKAIKRYNLNLRFNDNQTPLHIAAAKDHYGIVDYLLKNGAITSVQNNTGSTPLHTAITKGNYDIAKLLLNSGANVNARDSFSRTPLLLDMPVENQSELYNLILSREDVDISAKDFLGNTCLHIATQNWVAVSILENLVSKGADINARNEKGITPLAIAIDMNNKNQIQFYIAKGADIHAADKDQKTPFIRALASINEDNGITFLKYVVNQTNIASRDSYGNTPLHIAIRENTTIECINYLLKCGADIDARNSAGESLLYMVVKQNNREAGELLLSKGADIYSTDSYGRSPLYLALKGDKTLKSWFFCKTVVESCDGNGNTPLHYAVDWDDIAGIDYIINAKGDVNRRNSAGESPLFNAVRRDSAVSISILISKGANPNARDYLLDTPLHHAVRGAYLNAIDTLVVQRNIEINARNLAGKTPLSQAVIANHKEVTSKLIKHGADVNAYDDTGVTVLMDAVQNKSMNCFDVLLAAKANVNLPDMNGRNAYHEAAKIRDLQIIKILSKNGGNALIHDSYEKTPFSMLLGEDFTYVEAILGTDRNLVDTYGNNPIHEALNCKAPTQVVQKLIDMGYNIDQRNGLGLSPLNLAISLKLKDQAKVLIHNGADPFITDNNGECAISLCLTKDNQDILKEIVKSTVDKKMTDIYGQSILHYAARNASAETIKFILELENVDKTVKDNSGETPYDIAVRWKNTDAQKILKIVTPETAAAEPAKE